MEPVTVDVTDGRVTTLSWRGRRFRIRGLVDTWTWRGTWWQVDRRRIYYLLDCEEGMLEVYTDGCTWTLSRLMD